MRISKERRDARLRVTKMQLKILDAMDELSANQTETMLAMFQLQERWINEDLIEETPNPQE